MDQNKFIANDRDSPEEVLAKVKNCLEASINEVRYLSYLVSTDLKNGFTTQLAAHYAGLMDMLCHSKMILQFSKGGWKFEVIKPEHQKLTKEVRKLKKLLEKIEKYSLLCEGYVDRNLLSNIHLN